MADIVGSLKRKRSQIDELLKDQTRREGEKKALLDSLKSDFEVESIAEAETKLNELDEELDANEDSMRELDREMAAILQAAEDAKSGEGS